MGSVIPAPIPAPEYFAAPQIQLLFTSIFVYIVILEIILGLKGLLSKKVDGKFLFDEIMFPALLSWIITFVIAHIPIVLGMSIADFFTICFVALIIIGAIGGVLLEARKEWA